MKEHGGAPQGGAKPSQPKKVVTISERKLKANRENAKKSTGPKTTRGKASSRRNAVKHGLFINDSTTFDVFNEDPKEYEELLQGLWDQYQPVLRAEETEVERIALCFWRLKRVWRHENAVNVASMRDFVEHYKAHLSRCLKMDKEDQALLADLLNAKKQIEDTGRLSDEIRQKLAASPRFELQWSAIEEWSQLRMEEEDVIEITRTLDPQACLKLRDLAVVMRAIAMVEPLSRRRWVDAKEIPAALQAIPHSEDLDKILRYETTIERSLTRAHERLERLQRRRLGEFVPPPVRVQLS